MPPAISLEQACGFSVYMIQDALNGTGVEVIELAENPPGALSRVSS
jgi:hypothetical protein